ncbi:cell envelope integrity protein TolA [Psychrosphaera aquimarina]|jgi:colicin import membrane protein|uniref:Cell envelope integrity protein TolA n=1 Tax=Psychrosphaera aquimarina TaxID=2044854 RepID=A0ABU3R3W1_9GAMM|nr:cell envelope integrity protein TolA [Psychrosphaera aquimarina]MDU0114369.1 cell envelope integrity protein TolA [Psychrosphaera aquimarina]
MQVGEYIIHIIKSFGVHIFFGVILALSFNFTAPEKEPEVPEISAIDAVVIDQASLDKQVSKIKQQKLDAKAAEEKRVKDLEVRAEEAKRNLQKLEKQKTNSERAAADAKKKAAEEKKKALAEKRKAENATQERIKREKEADKAQKEALAAKRNKEAQEKAAEDAKKKKEAEQKALKEAEAERIRKEEEAKRKKEQEIQEAKEQAIREKMMQEQLAQEQSARNKIRQKYVLTEKQKYTALIMGRIQQYLIVDDSMKGQSCSLNIKLAFSGLVTSVNIISGDNKVCKAAERAVLKAETLPVSKEPDVYQELKDISLKVEPKL